MDKMNAYLKDRGFMVTREYVRSTHEYKFTLSKDGITKSYYWKYPKEAVPSCLSLYQKTAMDNMIKDFNEKKLIDHVIKPVVNSLYGSLETGYVYVPQCKYLDEEFEKYRVADVKTTQELIKRSLNMDYGMRYADIKKVIFNDPATIILWSDGTKTVVKAVNEPYDKEKGIAMAVTKRFFGNKGNYYNNVKKWLD